MTCLFKKIVEFLWKKYGAKGDRFGLMFYLANSLAFRISKDEEKKLPLAFQQTQTA